MLGPIFNREWLILPRRSRHYLTRSAYLGALWILSIMPQTASVVSLSVSPGHIVESLLIAIGSGLVAGAYPAWRASRLSPVEALRYE